ncbi:MAG TPA: hypothetical protein VGA53_04690 [Candidatus Paceibacterota bacterium]
MKAWITVFVALLFITACNAAPVPTATKTPTPTAPPHYLKAPEIRKAQLKKINDGIFELEITLIPPDGTGAVGFRALTQIIEVRGHFEFMPGQWEPEATLLDSKTLRFEITFQYPVESIVLRAKIRQTGQAQTVDFALPWESYWLVPLGEREMTSSSVWQ